MDSNDEDSVPGGNELGDSSHECQHIGVKSEQPFLCGEIPTEVVALA